MVIKVEDDFSDSSQELKNPEKVIMWERPNFSERPPQLSVSFMEVTFIYDIPAIDDYTPEEIKASWYTAEENQRIREDIKNGIMLLESGELVESRQRGLECRTKKAMRRKLYFRKKAYEAVFAEIDLQHEEGILDEVAIAEAYHFSCRSPAMLGRKMARKDAREAMQIYWASSKDRWLLNKKKVKRTCIEAV